jgi:nitrogen fixation NifU-like protein
MMSELDELYQSVILDHNRAPRNFRKLEDATAHAEGRNPLCGDAFEIWLKVEGDRISDAAFLGQGCAISKASASMMTQVIKGKTVEEAKQLFDQFHELVTVGKAQGAGSSAQPLPAKLEVFRGVRAFPIRVKCATLSWHAMKAALDRPIKEELCPTTK